MLKKYSSILYSILLIATSSLYSRSLESFVTQDNAKNFEIYCENLKTQIVTLSKNNQGALLNLLDSQFYVFSLLEQEMKKATVDQEKIQSMAEGFQKTLNSFLEQCDQKTKDAFEDIQTQIGSLVPKELIEQMQEAQEKMQKMYMAAKEKNLLNSKKFQKEINVLQAELMEKATHFQMVTLMASLKVYKIAHAVVSKTHKDLLLRRFDINGLIPLTKRKQNVIHPDKAEEVMNSFLTQAGLFTDEEENQEA